MGACNSAIQKRGEHLCSILSVYIKLKLQQFAPRPISHEYECYCYLHVHSLAVFIDFVAVSDRLNIYCLATVEK